MRDYVLIFIVAIVTLVVTLGFVPVDAFAAESYRVYQLTDNDVDDFDPRLNNNGYLLWSTHSGIGRESYLYDGSKTFKLPFVSGESNLILNNNNKILFNKQDDTNAGVYLFNINDQTITKIADNGLALDLNDNDYALWYAPVDSFYGNIYLYDGSTTIQVTNDSSYKWHCQLDNIGNVVVWYGGAIPPIDNLEIFQYDGMVTIHLTSNDYLDQFPVIANGNVVWMGFPPTSGSSGEIFLYDGSGTSKITDNNYTDQFPQVNNNGWVTWEGGDPDFEIFLYDGITTTQITENDYPDANPRINNSGQVAWYAYHTIDVEEYSLSYDDVFIYNGSKIIQLTDGIYQMGGNQHINDKGDVVWVAREVSVIEEEGKMVDIAYGDYEIFLARRVIEVQIDIMRGAKENCLNINGKTVIPMAIYGSEDFDVYEIDISSLRFSGLEVKLRGNNTAMCWYADYNRDSYLDLICLFKLNPDAWNPLGDTATLMGSLSDGRPIEGTYSICGNQ